MHAGTLPRALVVMLWIQLPATQALQPKAQFSATFVTHQNSQRHATVTISKVSSYCCSATAAQRLLLSWVVER